MKIKIGYSTTVLLLTVVWLLARAVVWIKNRRIDWKREAELLLMYVNLAVIIRFVFFPWEKVDGNIKPLVIDMKRMPDQRINLIPIVNILKNDAAWVMQNLVGNIALFIPSGVILPILYKKLDSLWKVTLAGSLISLSIELLQLLMIYRITDIDDLLCNTLGVMIGYGVYAMSKKLIGEIRRTQTDESPENTET